MLRPGKLVVIFAIMLVVSALSAGGALAGTTRGSDLETYRGTVSAGSTSVVTFNTWSNENGVIVSLQSRNGGTRTVKVFDPAGNCLTWITVPAGVTSVWSTYVAVNPSTTYRAEITNDSGSSKYLFYVNHCPNGQCF